MPTAVLHPDFEASPAPWNYNPSRWGQRIAIAGMAGIAAVIAAYLGLYQLRLTSGVWDPVFGDQSQQVLDSNVSQTMRTWFCVPDAILGSLAYIADIVFAMAGSTRDRGPPD